VSRTPNEIRADIAAVQKEMAPLHEKLIRLDDELKQCFLDNCGIKVGEWIMAHRGSGQPELAIVREINHFSLSKPWLTVSFKKKDGTWADRKRNVYSYWEKIAMAAKGADHVD